MMRRPVSGEVGRSKPSRSKDRRKFSNTADKTHYLNRSRRNIMRGGIRL